jgi:hypothetical protein
MDSGDFSGGPMKGKAGWMRASGVPMVVVCAGLVSLVANDSKNSAHGAYFKMKQVQVIDQAGFGKPTPAADLLIPTDWKFESNVQWANRGCFTDMAAVTFRAQSPDGRVVIEAFPSFSWQFSQDPSVQKFLMMENQDGAKVGLKPCPVNTPVPAEAVLRKVVVPRYRPGKEIAAVEPMPELNEAMTSRVNGLQQQSMRGGQQVQLRVDAARARLKYDLDGQPVEEWITAVSFAQATAISTGSSTTQGIDCRAVMLLAMRAPQGQLEANEKLFRTIRSSLRSEPDWQNQYLGMVSQLAQKQQIERQKRADLWRQFQQREIATINGVVGNSIRGANQAVVGADRLTRGVEPYRDPATGKTYELSYMYGHAWVNGNNNNEVVLSDDPNFNPASVFNGSWSPLEHVQPTP